MQGPFTWRKLSSGKKAVVALPPDDPCACQGSIGLTCPNGTVNTYVSCFTVGVAGSDTLGETDQICFTMTSGEQCPVDPPISVLPCTPGYDCYSGSPAGPNGVGCPNEKLMEFGLFCHRPFTSTNTTAKNTCIEWLRNPSLGTYNPSSLPAESIFSDPYYYLPAGDTQIDSTLLCVNYASIDSRYRRLQLISGRNRDLYGGPLAAYYRKGYVSDCFSSGTPEDPQEQYEGFKETLLGLTSIGHNQISITRGTNIASGQSPFGGTFPLEDGVLALPLFGANSRLNPTEGYNPECPGSPCCDTDPDFEYGESCFGCKEPYSGAYGHYLPIPSFSGATSGYFSFACFNPHSFLYENGTRSAGANLDESARRRIEFPACSLWAYIKGIRDYIYNAERLRNIRDNQNCQDIGQCCGPTAFDINWVDGSSQGDTWWSTIDPGGTNAAGISNVKLVMENLQRRVQKVGVYETNGELCDGVSSYEIVTPNVFLWDKDSFLAASTANRWKHIYTIGYSNILWDSGCTNTPDDSDGDEETNRNELIYVDNIAHDVAVGATNACRLLGWIGCDKNPIPGTFATRIRQMRCDGRDYSSNSPPADGFIDCNDCLTHKPENCGNPFWRGYPNSVTGAYACPNAPAFLNAGFTSGLFANHSPIQNSTNWLTGQGLVHIFSAPPNPQFPGGETFGWRDTTLGIELVEGQDLDPYPYTGASLTYGLTNGYAPRPEDVLKFATFGGCNNEQPYLSNPTGFYFVQPWHVVIRKDNKMQQWGSQNNTFSEALNGTRAWFSQCFAGESNQTLYIKFPDQTIDVKDVAIAHFHGLALKTDGSLYTWGISGNYPSINESNQRVITDKPTGNDFVFVAAYNFVDTNMTGNNTVPNCTNPRTRRLTEVSAAIRANGKLEIWGDNHFGQVGPDTSTNPWLPTPQSPHTGAFFAPPYPIIPRPTDEELAAEGGCTFVAFGTSSVGVITNSPDGFGFNQYKVKIWGWYKDFFGQSWTYNWHIPNDKLARNARKLVILDPFCCVILKNDGSLHGWGSAGSNGTQGWPRMIEQGILNETNVSDIGVIGSRLGTYYFRNYQALVVRRTNGTIKLYHPQTTWTWPSSL